MGAEVVAMYVYDECVGTTVIVMVVGRKRTKQALAYKPALAEYAEP